MSHPKRHQRVRALNELSLVTVQLMKQMPTNKCADYPKRADWPVLLICLFAPARLQSR